MDVKDRALSIEDSGLPHNYTPENGGLVFNERALIRKSDSRLLPAVSFLYLLSFLDRSNGKPVIHEEEFLELTGS